MSKKNIFKLPYTVWLFLALLLALPSCKQTAAQKKQQQLHEHILRDQKVLDAAENTYVHLVHMGRLDQAKAAGFKIDSLKRNIDSLNRQVQLVPK